MTGSDTCSLHFQVWFYNTYLNLYFVSMISNEFLSYLQGSWQSTTAPICWLLVFIMCHEFCVRFKILGQAKIVLLRRVLRTDVSSFLMTRFSLLTYFLLVFLVLVCTVVFLPLWRWLFFLFTLISLCLATYKVNIFGGVNKAWLYFISNEKVLLFLNHF